MFGAASGKKLKAVVVPQTPNSNIPVSNGAANAKEIGSSLQLTNNDVSTIQSNGGIGNSQSANLNNNVAGGAPETIKRKSRRGFAL